MPSLVDLISQRFNGMFNAPGPPGYVDDPSMGGLVAALQGRTMPGAMPAMPTVPLPNSIAMQQPQSPQPPQMGMGGPPGAPMPPPQPSPQTQPQAPMGAPQQPQQRGLAGFLNSPKGDALMGLLAGWAQGGTVQQSLGAGGVGAVEGMKQGKKNKTLQMFLDSQPNMDPAIKGMLSSDPDLARQYIATMLKGGAEGTTAEITNWKFAQEHPDFAKMIGNQGGSLFGTPVPYVKPDGSMGYALPSRSGETVDMAAPGGGTYLGPGGVASEKAAGAKQGEAAFNLPSVERAIGVLQGNVSKLLTEPGLSRVTGLYGANTPNITGEARKAQSYIDQVLGGTFLAAYNDLRGAGAITESEGAKAVDAYNRLRATNMDTEDYKQALADFNEQLNTMLAVARQKAAKPAQHGTTDGGGVVDYQDFFK